MKKRLETVQVTRRGHVCSYSGCGKRIPGRGPALALVMEEVVDGKTEKCIAYYCNFACYNDHEASLFYAESNG